MNSRRVGISSISSPAMRFGQCLCGLNNRKLNCGIQINVEELSFEITFCDLSISYFSENIACLPHGKGDNEGVKEGWK